MKYLVFIVVLLGLFSCQEKDCEVEGTGTLCFCNEMDSTRINVHIGPTVIFSVEPQAIQCTEALPAGNYEAYIQYVRLYTALGKNIYMYPTVVSCKEINVRVKEDS